MKRCLIMLMGSVGDVTRGLVLPAQLRKAFPDLKIAWAVEPLSEAVVRMNRYVDEVIVFDRKRGLRGIPSFVKALRAFEPDVVLDLQRHAKSGLFTFLSGAKRRIGFHRKNAKEGNWIFQSETIPFRPLTTAKRDQYLLFLSQVGVVDPAGNDYGLSLPEVPEQFRDVASESPIGIVLGSAWPSKDWPITGYVGLLKSIRLKTQAPIVLFGSKGQREIGEKVMQASSISRVVNSAGSTSLAELAALIKTCRVVTGPDSGPGHLAAACGVPYVSLFGPTDPTRTAPEGYQNLVVKASVPCAPCYYRVCPGLNQVCMRLISPGMVMRKLDSFL